MAYNFFNDVETVLLDVLSAKRLENRLSEIRARNWPEGTRERVMEIAKALQAWGAYWEQEARS